MKKYILLSLLICCLIGTAVAQQKKYSPAIEPCDCRFLMDSNMVKTAPANLKAVFKTPFEKIDSTFKTKCGYLIGMIWYGSF